MPISFDVEQTGFPFFLVLYFWEENKEKNPEIYPEIELHLLHLPFTSHVQSVHFARVHVVNQTRIERLQKVRNNFLPQTLPSSRWARPKAKEKTGEYLKPRPRCLTKFRCQNFNCCEGPAAAAAAAALRKVGTKTFWQAQRVRGNFPQPETCPENANVWGNPQDRPSFSYESALNYHGELCST